MITKTKNKIYFLLFFICLFNFVFSTSSFAKGNAPKEIEVKEAAKLIKEKPGEILILDVRTPAEFTQGHIPNAKNMDFFGGRFDIDSRSLPKDETILLYCRSGKRSAGAADVLQEAGYENILHMHEGLEGWQKAGLPIEKENANKDESDKSKDKKQESK